MSTEGILVKEHREDGNFILTVMGDVLISNAAGLERHLDDAIASGAQTITLDISGVGYMDSFGIGVVVQTQSKVDDRHSRFRVLVNEPLSRVFFKSHLDQYIDISVKPSSGSAH
ncbi:MAG: STAS domain-containing protein [bacterium]